jgi:TonB-linked SusC/RagA family outer membrane protein
MSRLPWPAVTTVFCVLLAAPLSAQQASISGTVRDEADGRALAGAAIQVAGSSAFVTTNAEGVYRLRGLSPGTYQLRLVMMGYASATQTATLEAGQSITIDWTLRPVPFALAEIVGTATGDQLTRELGNSVARVAAGDLVTTAPVSNVTQVLSGRIAGVSVLQSSGVTGQGARIRIRGLSSISLSNEPEIFLDGVRINSRTSGIDALGAASSFLNDINPEDIESVEVVKGPAASTLYGTNAANGVIMITTRQGRAGTAQWTSWLEAGLLKDTYEYPSTWFSAREGSTTLACFPYQQALGQCRISGLHRLSLFEDPATSPLGTGNRQQLGMSVSGGSELVRYFVSGEYERELGILKTPDAEVEVIKAARGVTSVPFEQRRPNELNKWNGRVNLSASPTSNLALNLSLGGVRSRLRLPKVGDNGKSYLGSAIGGSANPNLPESARWGGTRPAEAAGELTYRTTNRITNALTANWQPRRWLTSRATAGIDATLYDDEQYIRNGEGSVTSVTQGFADNQGRRSITRYNNTRFSVDLNASAAYQPAHRLGSRTSAGVQFSFDHASFVRSQGSVLPPGIMSINAAANRTTGEGTSEAKTLGQYLEQQLSLDDRLFVTGAVRLDANSSFGREARTAVYPKAGVSFVAIEGRRGLLTGLRLRGAYGQSGTQAGPTTALTYEQAVTSSVLGALNTPGVVLGQIGDPTLRPERSSELEVGVDVGLAEDRLRLDVTVFNKTSRDALVRRSLPPSYGATASRFENIGEVNNKGIEVSLNVRPVDRPGLTWDVNVEASAFRNRLVSLGEGVLPLTGFTYENRPGYPLYGMWWPGLKSFEDRNNDGFIDPSEVVVSDTVEFLGSTIPTRQMHIANTLSVLQGRVRVGVLGEYRGGFVGLETNTGFNCAFRRNCRALHDPTAPLEDQARAVAGGGLNALGAYVMDASFFRVRELSITYSAAQALARAVGARSLNATVAARNLALFTSWPSWDPENSTSGADAVSYNWQVLRQPLVLTLRFNLGY